MLQQEKGSALKIKQEGPENQHVRHMVSKEKDCFTPNRGGKKVEASKESLGTPEITRDGQERHTGLKMPPGKQKGMGQSKMESCKRFPRKKKKNPSLPKRICRKTTRKLRLRGDKNSATNKRGGSPSKRGTGTIVGKNRAACRGGGTCQNAPRQSRK